MSAQHGAHAVVGGGHLDASLLVWAVQPRGLPPPKPLIFGMDSPAFGVITWAATPPLHFGRWAVDGGTCWFCFLLLVWALGRAGFAFCFCFLLLGSALLNRAASWYDARDLESELLC